MLNKAIGILGGTFDPIHFGHINSAIELRQLLDLDEIRFIPCFQPVHRNTPAASPEDRLAMTQMAIIGEPGLIVDDREIKRRGPSYMYDTLQSIRSEKPTSPLCLLLGIDAFLGFPEWYRYEEILELAHLVIAHRPQYQLPTTGIIQDLLRQRQSQNYEIIHTSLAGKILLIPTKPIDISATDLRKQIIAGKSPYQFMPDCVYKYIKEHGIYKSS